MKTTAMNTFLRVLVVTALVFSFGCGERSSRHEDLPPIAVGAILPLSGSGAELAVQHMRGLELGIETINTEGGIDGRKLRLFVEDDHSDPKTTISAFRKLASVDGAKAVVTVLSGPSMAVAPLADQGDVILFANCGHPEVTTLHKKTFRNFPSSRLEVELMARFCHDNLQLHSIWMLYIDDAYGLGAKQLAETEFAKYGISILGFDAYGKTGSDLRPALLRVKSADPNAVYLYGYGQATADAANQLREVGCTNLLLGSYNFSQPPLTTIASNAINNSYYTVPEFDAIRSGSADDFRNRHLVRYGVPPAWNAAIEFDAVHILASALRAAKDESGTLLATLGRVGNYNGACGSYVYDPTTREWRTPMRIAHLQAGQVEFVNVR